MKGVQTLFRKTIEFEASKQAIQACETIISEIGAELHDDLIQRLSILRLRLDKLETCYSDPQLTKEVIKEMQDDFLCVTNSVRRISKTFLPTRFDNDSFENTILTLCQTVQSAGVCRVQLDVEGTTRKIHFDIETHLIRMIQELIHNSLRHSAAWHVWVRIRWTGKYLIIQVEDDGSGFARIQQFVDKLKKKNNTLRMRALAIGAKLEYSQGKNGLLATIEYKQLT